MTNPRETPMFAETFDDYWRAPLWSEVLPNLWQGGTHDDDVVGNSWCATEDKPRRAKFDSVYTLYERAAGAGRLVKEVRFPFYDGDMSDFSPETDLFDIVCSAHTDWKNGKRVLIRCQAGINRSGLVMALVLIRDGFTPEAAIEQIRRTRGGFALNNNVFTSWLTEQANVAFWQAGQVGFGHGE